jgi:hypothetical protein
VTYCSDCSSVEQGFTRPDDDEDAPQVCNVCGMEDTAVSVDEDYGQDR